MDKRNTINKLGTYFLNRIHNSFIKQFPTRYDFDYEGRKIMREMRIGKKRRYRTMIPRLWERRSPAQEEKQHQIARQRWKNRVQVNFICKYVLAIKNRKIPLN